MEESDKGVCAAIFEIQSHLLVRVVPSRIVTCEGSFHDPCTVELLNLIDVKMDIPKQFMLYYEEKIHIWMESEWNGQNGNEMYDNGATMTICFEFEKGRLSEQKQELGIRECRSRGGNVTDIRVWIGK